MSEENTEPVKFDAQELASLKFGTYEHLKNLKMLMNDTSKGGLERIIIHLLFAPTDVYMSDEDGNEKNVPILRKKEENLLNYCNKIIVDKNHIAQYAMERFEKNGGNNG